MTGNQPPTHDILPPGFFDDAVCSLAHLRLSVGEISLASEDFDKISVKFPHLNILHLSANPGRREFIDIGGLQFLELQACGRGRLGRLEILSISFFIVGRQ